MNFLRILLIIVRAILTILPITIIKEVGIIVIHSIKLVNILTLLITINSTFWQTPYVGT